jgi:hypothetical protein
VLETWIRFFLCGSVMDRLLTASVTSSIPARNPNETSPYLRNKKTPRPSRQEQPQPGAAQRRRAREGSESGGGARGIARGSKSGGGSEIGEEALSGGGRLYWGRKNTTPVRVGFEFESGSVGSGAVATLARERPRGSETDCAGPVVAGRGRWAHCRPGY